MTLAIALLTACGGGGGTDVISTPAQTTPVSGTSTPSPAPSPAPTPAPAPAPTAPTSTGTDVLTYKNDIRRTGQNPTESILTPANVMPASFGLLRVLATDGKVDAQPLYVSQLALGRVLHNVVLIATEHDSVYADDADTGATLWKVSLLGAGETLSDAHGCGQVTPEIGITSTPVIDRQAGAHGTVFVVGMSKDAAGAYHQRLHALDLTSGTELLGGPTEIAATYPTAGGGITPFSPGQYEERAALLLTNGTLYTSWTSHCDIAPYTGWIIAYAEGTLVRSAVLNVAPNGGAGPAIWMSGGGPAADAAGNIYLLTANGAFETSLDANGFPGKQDYGNSFLKLSSNAAALTVADYFTVMDEVAASNADRDLGSGGVMLLPDLNDAAGTTHHLMVGAGKDGNVYVVDRDSPGRFNPGGNAIWQQLSGALPGGIWSTPAYFNGTVYYGDVGSTLKAFTIVNARLAAVPQSQSPSQFPYPGTAPQRVGPTAPPTASSGRTRIPIPRCCTPTTQAISPSSFTTATRPPATAIGSGPATSTSRPRSLTARCWSAPPPAWRCSACCIETDRGRSLCGVVRYAPLQRPPLRHRVRRDRARLAAELCDHVVSPARRCPVLEYPSPNAGMYTSVSPTRIFAPCRIACVTLAAPASLTPRVPSSDAYALC